MPEAAGAGAAAPDPTVDAMPGWALDLIAQGVSEDSVRVAVAAATAPPPLSPEEHAAAADALRAQADEDLANSLASAEETRERGQALVEGADAQIAKAHHDHDQAHATATRIATGPETGPEPGGDA